ncbi:DinB family protein [Flavobacteriaceae bacterium S356]|uniref:DinB family protein n=1 Tax=Asprobacillus argus TaxID=3076534 RepID=A0ABU3LHV2_9FLAO|nr:DinB family protein [Flavobacteriaceae bacterium S356]
MRQICTLFIALLCIQCANDTNQLSEKEREFAIEELNKSRNNLLKSIANLNAIQLNFKSDTTSWSISENTEHVTLFIDEVFEILEESLELPANPERRKDVKFSDKELIDFIQNRANKNKTLEDFEPRSTYGDHVETVNILEKKLAKHINYLKTTKDDLRNHYVNFGTVDAYQIFLYMAAHTNRHVAQIKEIKNHINFPIK